MPLEVGGIPYYRTTEAARRAGISRSTLLRWLSDERISIPDRRDRNGWRLFSDEDLVKLKEAVEHVETKE